MSLAQTFRRLRAAIAYMGLPENERRLTFYSEGQNYFSYLGGMLNHVLENSDIDVCYISSSPNDPGLKISHPRLKQFEIGEGVVRDFLLSNMDTRIFVTTMPDIGQYQVKKSKKNVHYVYVQHSLVSLHMVYRPGAFDAYDTIFCAGPHHLVEMRALEGHRDLAPKRLFNHGYVRLDEIRRTAKAASNVAKSHALADQRHALLAPSWGDNAIIESGVGKIIVDKLLSQGHAVTLRPHPQTIKFHGEKVDEIVDTYKDHSSFVYEGNVFTQDSLHTSDVMICDWSGAALDYAFGLLKPVIFIDVPRKVNNPEYTEIDVEPFEVFIRNEVGCVVDPSELDKLDINFETNVKSELADKNVFNIERSGEVGGEELIRMTNALSAGDSLTMA